MHDFSVGIGIVTLFILTCRRCLGGCRYQVPPHLRAEFTAVWAERESIMKQFPGFQGVQMFELAPDTISVASSWASIPEWEAFDLSAIAKRVHFPVGIYQYNPAKGEGFPETFVPFIAPTEPINAKY